MNKILYEGKAADLAHKLGLVYAGHAYWKNKKGKVVAKTVKDVLTKTSKKDVENYKSKNYTPDMDQGAIQASWPSGPAYHDVHASTPYETNALKDTAQNILAKKIGKATGTNPGGVFQGTDNVERYVKEYTDPGQTFGEILADKFYNDLDIGAPEAVYFDNDVGLPSVVFASTVVPNIHDLKDVWEKLDAPHKKLLANRILKGFAADCLLANWDVVGVNEGFMRNIVVDEQGTPWRIDNGSAFLSRGLNGRKTDIPGYNPLELSEPVKFFANPSYKEILKAADVNTPSEVPNLNQQVHDILKLHNAVGGWKQYVEDLIPDANPDDKNLMIKMLYHRTKSLINLVNML